MIDEKKLFQDQSVIVQMISSGAPLKKILSFIVASIEKYCNPIKTYSSIMLYNPQSRKLEETVSVSLPQLFVRTIEPVEVGPYEGSCGTAAYLKRPVIVSDIENDVLWNKYRNSALQFGLHSCWSIPILSSDKQLLGTLALYYKEVYEPDEKILSALEFYNRLAVIAIECAKVNRCLSKAY